MSQSIPFSIKRNPILKEYTQKLIIVIEQYIASRNRWNPSVNPTATDMESNPDRMYGKSDRKKTVPLYENYKAKNNRIALGSRLVFLPFLYELCQRRRLRSYV